MAFLTPLWIQQLPGDTALQYTGNLDRQLLDMLVTVPGVVRSADLKVSQRGAGANLSVDVAAGSWIGQGLATSNQGKYAAESTTVFNTGTLASSPSAGNTRIDSVVAVVYDKQADSNSQSGAAAYSWAIVAVAGGQSTGTPSPPTLTTTSLGCSAFLELARLTRTPSEGSIVNAAITDMRARAITATHEVVIRATPLANHILGGPFGCTSVVTVGPYPYDTVHDIRFGEVLGQSVLTDATEAYLFVDNATQVRGGRGTGEWNTIFGTYISDLVPAGTSHSYQVIANRYSGSGYWDCFADSRFNYLECVVRPT